MLITKDGFVWMDVTERVSKGDAELLDVWSFGNLYVLYSDGSDSLVEDKESFLQYLEDGLRFVIEVGYLKNAEWL